MWKRKGPVPRTETGALRLMCSHRAPTWSSPSVFYQVVRFRKDTPHFSYLCSIDGCVFGYERQCFVFLLQDNNYKSLKRIIYFRIEFECYLSPFPCLVCSEQYISGPRFTEDMCFHSVDRARFFLLTHTDHLLSEVSCLIVNTKSVPIFIIRCFIKGCQ